MILSYEEIIEPSERQTVEARLTTEHSMSSYGQPVLVLKDGQVVDLVSWKVFQFKVEQATEQERETLKRTGFPF